MSDKKKHFYKTLNNIVATNRIDNEETYIINDYVSGLENQLQQKENIIKEVREYIENNITANSNDDGDYWYEITEPIDEFIIDLKEILDKENK